MAKRKYGFGAALGQNAPKPAKPAGFGATLGAGGNAAHQAQVGPVSPGSAQTGVAPAPLDPQFMEYQAQAGRNLQVSQLGAAYQSSQIGNEYGFGSDKSNPYSQAKLLEESYKRSKLGTTNNYASSGQLHSGAYGRMQGENDRNYSIGVDRGTRDMNNALGQVALGQLQDSANYGVGMTGEGLNALMNAFKNRFGG